MTPIPHPTNNLILHKPDSMSEEECISLLATRVIYPDGTYGINSYWQPTPKELELLNSNGIVKLTVLGFVTPPVAVNTSTKTEI